MHLKEPASIFYIELICISSSNKVGEVIMRDYLGILCGPSLKLQGDKYLELLSFSFLPSYKFCSVGSSSITWYEELDSLPSNVS